MEKNKKIIAGIAGAVALIAIVAVCIFAFGSSKREKDNRKQGNNNSCWKQLQYLKLQHSLKVSVCLQESI
ncbi:MAG: hypothetical protein ACLUR5_15480 [Eubacterium ventriosum]